MLGEIKKAACAADTVDSGRAKRLRSAYECIGVDVPLAGPVGADARPSWKAGLMPAGNGDAVSSTRSEVGPLPKSESGSKGERASSHTLDGGKSSIKRMTNGFESVMATRKMFSPDFRCVHVGRES